MGKHFFQFPDLNFICFAESVPYQKAAVIFIAESKETSEIVLVRIEDYRPNEQKRPLEIGSFSIEKIKLSTEFKKLRKDVKEDI